jgi:hypothetical protein
VSSEKAKSKDSIHSIPTIPSLTTGSTYSVILSYPIAPTAKARGFVA